MKTDASVAITFVEFFILLDNAMSKISTNESAGNLVTLQLEKQLIGTWISELNAAVSNCSPQAARSPSIWEMFL